MLIILSYTNDPKVKKKDVEGGLAARRFVFRRDAFIFN